MVICIYRETKQKMVKIDDFFFFFYGKNLKVN